MDGIFLGAGASYEVGMPLVWEFTDVIRKNILKRLHTKLFNFHGDEKAKDFFKGLIEDKTLHYEDMVGLLEEKYLDNELNREVTHHIILQFIECIQLLLLEIQGNINLLFKAKVNHYVGLRKILEKKECTYVFSLNHDVVFESICNHHNIRFKDGFYHQNTNYSNIANFKCLTAKQIDDDSFDFFKDCDSGFNLIKLHGSIDMFAVEDKLLFLKVYGDTQCIDGIFNEIRKVENINISICKRDGLRTANEVLTFDNDGELQFLRRSLLSGKHKFQKRFQQIVPVSFMNLFEKRIDKIDCLSVIGYSFGDKHINEILKNWFEKNNNRKVVVYDPFLTMVPEIFNSNANRVDLIQGGFTDFCNAFETETNSQLYIENKFLSMIREELRKKNIS